MRGTGTRSAWQPDMPGSVCGDEVMGVQRIHVRVSILRSTSTAFTGTPTVAGSGAGGAGTGSCRIIAVTTAQIRTCAPRVFHGRRPRPLTVDTLAMRP